LRQGERVRVDLFVSVPAARNFVVVNDPVPGGLEPVNSDLANASSIDAQLGQYRPTKSSWWHQYKDWRHYGRWGWSFYHRELRHDSARFFSDYLPAGNYHLSYVAQAVARGQFASAPVKAEEMYDADIFGIGKPSRLIITKSDSDK
nr:hypothetical protein [Gammaproteobacteria bacterium]